MAGRSGDALKNRTPPMPDFMWIRREPRSVSGWLTLADEVETPLDTRDIDPGTSVLVAGPTMTGKRDLMLDVLGGSRDRTACVVTTKKRARRITEWFDTTISDSSRWDRHVVDCVGGSGTFSAPKRTGVDTVASPRDLTGIGIALSGYMQDKHSADVDDVRIGLHTLSTLLMYTDLQPVYRFTHVITSRIDTAGFVGAFTLDTTSRDTETLNRLTQLFDALVEVDQDETGRKLRVRGGSFGPRDWTYL
jgi:hypothetical protein